MRGVRDEAATRALIVQENRRYARRQLIWFRKEPNLKWFDGPGERDDDAVIERVACALWARRRSDAAATGNEGRPGQPNIQDVFLNYARRERLARDIRLMDGRQFEGRIKNFDRFAVIVESGRHRPPDVQARDRDDQHAALGRELLLPELMASAVRRRLRPDAPPVLSAPRGRSFIVLDSVGIGELPDAAPYGDEGSNTLGNIAARVRCGSRRCGRWAWRDRAASSGVPPPRAVPARRVRADGGGIAREGLGDGHWEMMGIVLDRPFPTFPQVSRRSSSPSSSGGSGAATLGNVVASGTEIIDRLGAEHMRTGTPIVYTSADSVFQIAAHEDVIPVPELYRICEIAFELVGRGHGRRPRHRAAVRRRARALSSEPRTATISRCRRAARRCSIA